MGLAVNCLSKSGQHFLRYVKVDGGYSIVQLQQTQSGYQFIPFVVLYLDRKVVQRGSKPGRGFSTATCSSAIDDALCLDFSQWCIESLSTVEIKINTLDLAGIEDG